MFRMSGVPGLWSCGRGRLPHGLRRCELRSLGNTVGVLSVSGNDDSSTTLVTVVSEEKPDTSARLASGPFRWLQSWFFRVEINNPYDHRSWGKHKDPFRHVKAWLPGNLTDIRRLVFPDIAQVAVVAGGVTWYNKSVANEVLLALDTDGDGEVSNTELRAGIDSGLIEANHVMGQDFFTTSDMLLLATTPFTLTAIAMGMLLAFRNQNCHGRYEDARRLLGALTNESRALSARLLAVVPPHLPGHNHLASARQASLDAVKCIMTFGRALKYHVTVDGFCPTLEIPPRCTDAELDRMKTAALEAELAGVWDYSVPRERAYVDRLLADGVTNRPLHVLQELSELTGGVLARPIEEGGGGLHPAQTDGIFRSITRFQDILGGCERIYKTPVYGGYTKFTSRCVYLWTNFLPMALYPVMGPVGTIPTSIVVASFLYGLDDVGATIEEPFSCLPLGKMVDGIHGSCQQMIQQQHTIASSRCVL
eukprot:CAMPEP_0119157794 /NCGR_PEP_ID=MMETSP1310-20130426/52938_1 /TAXON_ID=464262 /ORGANISM="Genus nov. species nov., Strain RCC2339" /LENGTH=477 /DNA_ID=CAMNT_0007150413 /DNA_START=91 /DNA_END=1524 /DNA_ORIENTATION=-